MMRENLRSRSTNTLSARQGLQMKPSSLISKNYFATTSKIIHCWHWVIKNWVLSYFAILLIVYAPAARGDNISYMVMLSPDGSRVAVGKTEKRPQWTLFEGPIAQPLRQVEMPAGLYSTGSFVYSPDGKELLFVATARTAAGVVPAGSTASKADVERLTITNSLWRSPVGGSSTLATTKIFESTEMGNPLPLLDGSIAFMGAVKRLKSLSASPLWDSGHRVWTSYNWMLRKPDGSIKIINPREYAFFSAASLIRDEAVFLVQERRVNGQPVNPREYELDVTSLKPSSDLSALARLATMPDRKGGPSVECDWSGKTCTRIMAYDKNQYLAHQLEIIRDGKNCKVDGLPDRLERSAVSRTGNAIVLVTRPNPYRDVGYQLVYIKFEIDNCVINKSHFALP